MERSKVNINIRSRNFEERVAIPTSSSKANREATCQLCLLIMRYQGYCNRKKTGVFAICKGNLSGEKKLYNEALKLNNQNSDYGLGINLDINKSLSIEATINPDFSQVESDVTKN